MEKNIRKVYCVKDKDTNKLLPKAGIWIEETMNMEGVEEMQKFLQKNIDCEIVQCELIEITEKENA